jgi:hypothetical protein
MLALSAYFNFEFVNGAAPTITALTAIWWYRPHPVNAVASADTLDAPEYASTLDDEIYVAVFVPTDSTASSVVITSALRVFLLAFSYCRN